jgi:hypothetical protein
MELHAERPLRLDRVVELRAQRHLYVGSFVVYLSCASLIFVTFTKPTLVWIPQGKSRFWNGVSQSMSTLVVGWWSFAGILNTLLVLAHNLLGGFELTTTIMDPRTRDGEFFWKNADRSRAFQRRRFILFLAMLSIGGLIVAPAIAILLLDVVIPRWLR